MRDKYGVSNDPYCWPGTSVLRNKLDIHDEATLADAEAEFAAVALEHIDIEAPPFDLEYLCRLHRQLFGDVYEWAGEVRTIDLSKGTTRFCTSHRIVPEADKVMQALGDMAPWHASRDVTIGHIAECFGELNLIHPFREGNGRTARLFFEHFLALHGYTVNWGKVERDNWIAACIAAVECDYTPLEEVLDRCIDDLPQEPHPATSDDPAGSPGGS